MRSRKRGGRSLAKTVANKPSEMKEEKKPNMEEDYVQRITLWQWRYSRVFK
jgi:hypothetical protein